MPIRKSSRGSGLTETEVYHIEGNLTPEEETTLNAFDLMHAVEGRLQEVERVCFPVLEAAGLPTEFKGAEIDRVGNWRRFGETSPALSGGRIYSDAPWWPVAERRGYAPDSPIGFAAQLIDLAYWIRRAAQRGDNELVAMRMFYLGVKWASSGIKERHGQKSGRKPAAVRRDVELARKYMELSETSHLSPSALKAKVGTDYNVEISRRIDELEGKASAGDYRPPKPLSRSQAIAAIDRGLEILSG